MSHQPADPMPRCIAAPYAVNSVIQPPLPARQCESNGENGEIPYMLQKWR
jgi:hypothetical protein